MAEKTDPSPAPAFRVGWAAIVVLSVSAGLSALLVLPEADGAREIGVVVGTVVAAVGLPLLVGWVVFRFGGRSAANPVIIVVALASVCGSMSRRAERRQAVERLEDKLRTLADSRAADDPAAQAKAADEAIAAIEQLGEASPRDRDDLQVMARMLRRLQEPTQELQALIEEFLGVGGVKSSTLPTLAAIDARMELVGRVRVKAELVRDKVKHFVPDAEAELRAGGVDPRMIEGFLSTAREQAGRLETTLELRESTVRYFAACQEILTLLRAHFGAWRTEPGGGSFVFDRTVPEADIAAYNRVLATIKAEAATQQRLEQQLAGAGR